MILILTILPLLALGQNTQTKQSTPQISKECSKLAKDHQSECEPVFSDVDFFITLCPKSGSCSSEQKKKPLTPICASITKLKKCYKVLTPACYSQKVTDSVLKIFESECKKVSGGSKTTQSSDSKTGSKDTTDASKEKTDTTKDKTTDAKETADATETADSSQETTDAANETAEAETEKSSGETLLTGTKSLFLAVLLALSIL